MFHMMPSLKIIGPSSEGTIHIHRANSIGLLIMGYKHMQVFVGFGSQVARLD